MGFVVLFLPHGFSQSTGSQRLFGCFSGSLKSKVTSLLGNVANVALRACLGVCFEIHAHPHFLNKCENSKTGPRFPCGESGRGNTTSVATGFTLWFVCIHLLVDCRSLWSTLIEFLSVFNDWILKRK